MKVFPLQKEELVDSVPVVDKMKKLLIILLCLIGCSEKNESKEKIAFFTPLMYKACFKLCNNLHYELDSISIILNSGYNSIKNSSRCSLTIECVCENKTHSYITIIPKDEFYITISNSTKSSCLSK